MVNCLPQIPQFDEIITAEEVEAVISKLLSGKARGMDGFSMPELKSFGPQEHDLLAQLFNTITATGEWPQALLSSFVALLAKVPHPQSPKDARPITVLPTLYRLWGKIMGAKIMRALLPYLPKDLFGSVPGRSASDAAWELQTALEQAACGGDDIVGVSLDLSKAYNTIPREVVSMLADKCGWPASLKRAYLSFHQNFHRFFKVHGGFHCPTYSDTGIPEGCPIAVPVMIMVTFLAWMEHIAAKIQGKPDVDGIQAVDFAFSTKLRNATQVQPHVLGSFTSNAAVPSRQKRKFLPPEETLCKHCGQEDDAKHRLLHCPHFQQARAHVSLEHALQWPTLLVTRGLARKPASLQAWDDLNFNRSWPMMPECLDHGMHLFIDGSTDGSRSVPRSAWSVVMLEPGSFDYALVQSGPLPGKQCNYRAEMFATLAALCSSVNATVYIDNKSVVQGLHRLQRDGWDQFYWNKSPEIQLWREIWEAWTAFGNDTADRYAKNANQAREHSEVKLYQAACRALADLQN
ncbi:LINE-1 retrotransposable element ORF2 protein [Symbiodinium microadriaticum]|uniref:LINE-1 retrotransposable element ORF2 protein n=1 Tax=Symbiodinium microadriaticum TaxID=2951 RepID=A0A1Q9CRR9_SYMMI|nr:LINE-1 retrotransposable element ORF2 protein [Symbiodinium microadriaticum]